MNYKLPAIVSLSLTSLCVVPLEAQPGAQNGEWHFYGGDAGTVRRPTTSGTTRH
jgi:hypothetical protein